MACCGRGKSKGQAVVDRVKVGQTYYDKYTYLTPQQLAEKRRINENRVFCKGCGDVGLACPAETYFDCAKRKQLGL